MIEEIDVDEVLLPNLMPFPGTSVFEQAVRDRLFVDEIDLDNMWRMTGFRYHNNVKFYIKPYKMEIEELNEFREKFDRLLSDMRNRKNRERQYA